MGCTASKLDNEDTVRRCKERRRLMKEAVYARHHLAAAHSDYCRSLRLTGSALVTFATEEPLSVSDNTPAVFLHAATTPVASTTTTTAKHPQPLHIPSPSPSLHPPPPPHFSPSPSPTIASSKLPHILSSSSINSGDRRRKPSQPKLPHILSESSPSSSPQSQRSNFPSGFFPTAYQANSTYSRTPSQASSVWNWENFYPPSPPGSEYFRNRAQAQQPHHQKLEEYHKHNHHLETEDFDDDDTERSEYDFFHGKPDPLQTQKSRHHYQNHDQEYTETEREEVQCSEWGDHYSTTSSSDEEEDEDDADSRSEIGTRSNFGSSVRAESVTGVSTTTAEPKIYRAPSKTEKSVDMGSSASYRTSEMMDMKIVVRHKDLKEIVEAIKENFDKAAAAGDQVSEMLEISSAQLDRSFRQLRSKLSLLWVCLVSQKVQENLRSHYWL
ncbi:hypothetical protein L6164_000641 [Bauhinia variegata]|uniref:Uncharacterized protein n=1 Tax=Bauhinia variegata TaxID=167791 RepID=A0ACB9Q726_BAUVA|nr:hypothetical protein L6164_000641 [Bauhinia variegata]